MFYNHKGYYSIILLGVVDADYKFVWADIGAPGSSSDCQVFNGGPLRPALEDRGIQFPPAEPLLQDDRAVSYIFLGDDACPVRPQESQSTSHADSEDSAQDED
ncbi:Hypp2226 [Branchiostoma lanceolatum]|uniref:Hypp2226 protein n=1 Tax=Branchiostoma lanceolatum TaxID=7740 RepID=A0A8K0ESF5_BRALA|nr:Hypp2226 [Branchiostoma lanceolatum]